MANAIITENALPGSTGWQIPKGNITAIQGYCDKMSYSPGDTVTFFVSTQSGGTSYSIGLYRLGWYNGAGGRLITTISSLTGVAQGYFDVSTKVLNNCPTAIIDSTTHSLEAGWAASTTWSIPGNACSGVYVGVLTDGSNNRSYVQFVVRGSTTADYAVVLPHATYQAYNNWGGDSLYTSNSVHVSGGIAATKVSFNRPFAANEGSQDLLNVDLPAIRWLERQGYDMCYLSDLDVHASAGILNGHKVYISLGHDEYWSAAMRTAVENARDNHAISVAFFGANVVYWQIRMEADAASVANRTVVCYKVQTANSDLSRDPQYGVNNAIVTSTWADPVVNNPQTSLVGMLYGDFTNGSNQPWTADASMDTTYTAGTRLVAGSSYGCDMVGWEWDKVVAGSPANIKIIGTTPMTGHASQVSNSNTITYKAASGALVFASGSINFTYALDDYRFLATCTPTSVPAIQVLMANIMGALKGPVFAKLR